MCWVNANKVYNVIVSDAYDLQADRFTCFLTDFGEEKVLNLTPFVFLYSVFDLLFAMLMV